MEKFSPFLICLKALKGKIFIIKLLLIPKIINITSIYRYNPEHLKVIENYVEEQARENTYDLEANLAALKLYQFNPSMLNLEITRTILLKALTNFPHTDFVLCKCLLLPAQIKDEVVKDIIYMADILEQCDFEVFWDCVQGHQDLFLNINGFYDSIRKFVCHVVGITFQTIRKDYFAQLLGNVEDVTVRIWVKKYGWKEQDDLIYISNQDENIKTKNITEKIDFDNLAPLMAACL